MLNCQSCDHVSLIDHLPPSTDLKVGVNSVLQIILVYIYIYVCVWNSYVSWKNNTIGLLLKKAKELAVRTYTIREIYLLEFD